MKKLSFSLLSIYLSASLFSQGIKFDKEKYESFLAYKPQISQGYAEGNLPAKISYRAFCPPVLSQGQVSTCVGWATSYGLLSTQQNVLMGESNIQKKKVRVMDPNFVYALIRDYSDGWCQNGTNMGDAMEVLMNYGSKPLQTPPWLSCNSSYAFDKFALAIASIYTINNFYALIDTSDLVNTLKHTLINKKPIAVGMNVTESFATGSAIQYGKWSPSSSEKIQGGHAMCVIGYDDTKYGGSFELMNSYGTQFGDNGFVWISYTDMKKYMQEAYIIELNAEANGYRIGNCSFGDCYSTYSRYKYSSGAVYEGEFSLGYKNGWGTLLEADDSFYIGNFSNGYKHGWGIFYNPSTEYYYKTNYIYGNLQNSTIYQGFSGTEEDKKLDGLIEVLQGLNPGKIMDVKSEAYQELVDSSKPEEEPVIANPKLSFPPVNNENHSEKKGKRKKKN